MRARNWSRAGSGPRAISDAALPAAFGLNAAPVTGRATCATEDHGGRARRTTSQARSRRAGGAPGSTKVAHGDVNRGALRRARSAGRVLGDHLAVVVDPAACHLRALHLEAGG